MPATNKNMIGKMINDGCDRDHHLAGRAGVRGHDEVLAEPRVHDMVAEHGYVEDPWHAFGSQATGSRDPWAPRASAEKVLVDAVLDSKVPAFAVVTLDDIMRELVSIKSAIRKLEVRAPSSSLVK